jgi:hypothetical protein
VWHRDEPVAILRPDGELLDGPLFSRSRVRRVNEADKGRGRSPKAADLPSGDALPLTTTLTLTHGQNISRPSGESESPATRTVAVWAP